MPARRTRFQRLLPVAAALGCLAALLAGLGAVAVRPGNAPLDRRTLAEALPDTANDAWGFNFEPMLAAPERIVAAPPPREAIPALTDPEAVPAARMPTVGMTLDHDEWVAGVVLDGQARAWPASLLMAHECLNDTLAGRPIAVTYHLLGDSLAVYDRRVEGRTLEWGNSGLLLDGNSLLLDRQHDPHDESLWSQALGEAIAGPAAARAARLQRIDVERVPWPEWLRRHPETTVAVFTTGFGGDYSPDLYEPYLAADTLWFAPVHRTQRRPDLPDKSPMVVIHAGGTSKAYALRDLKAAPGGIKEETLGGIGLRLQTDAAGRIARIESTAPIVRQYLLWYEVDALAPQWPVDRHPDSNRQAGTQVK